MRRTNAEIREGIEWLEARGWSINADGTITRVRRQVKKIICDPRSNTEPRHTFWRGSKTYSVKVSDLIAAKFGLVAANGQPDEAEVESQADLEPETCPEPARVGCDEAEVDLRRDSETETQPVAAQRGPCGHCGGFMVPGVCHSVSSLA